MSTPYHGYTAAGHNPLHLTRRHFFSNCGVGLGKIALGTLLGNGLVGSAAAGQSPSNPLATRQPHFAPKAKRVIFLFMAGGPSQLDLFDEKPELRRLAGSPLPAEVTADQRLAFTESDAAVLEPQYKFARYGQSGQTISSIMPHLGEIADDVAFVKSLYTDQFNHAPAQIFLNTGDPLPGRPSLGSWVTYGLGNMTENLPSFVVLSSGSGTSGGRANYNSGFMPSDYSGVPFRTTGDPVINVSNPRGVDAELQRDSLDTIGNLNRRRMEDINHPEIAARINAYEMAFRLQASAPELMDFASESEQTLAMYGAKPGEASYANNCLMARRLVERGVRYVALFHEGWDHHSNVRGGLADQCGRTDQPSVALIKDLKQRGLLEDTLVVWGGEFGRTP
ncbi:MAG: DUF1501 domain-containing protein, partial [Phycisphaeraceae bacterium]